MKHYRSCNLCETICGLEIETDGRQILYIQSKIWEKIFYMFQESVLKHD